MTDLNNKIMPRNNTDDDKVLDRVTQRAILQNEHRVRALTAVSKDAIELRNRVNQLLTSANSRNPGVNVSLDACKALERTANKLRVRAIWVGFSLTDARGFWVQSPQGDKADSEIYKSVAEATEAMHFLVTIRDNGVQIVELVEVPALKHIRANLELLSQAASEQADEAKEEVEETKRFLQWMQPMTTRRNSGDSGNSKREIVTTSNQSQTIPKPMTTQERSVALTALSREATDLQTAVKDLYTLAQDPDRNPSATVDACKAFEKTAKKFETTARKFVKRAEGLGIGARMGSLGFIVPNLALAGRDNWEMCDTIHGGKRYLIEHSPAREVTTGQNPTYVVDITSAQIVNYVLMPALKHMHTEIGGLAQAVAEAAKAKAARKG